MSPVDDLRSCEAARVIAGDADSAEDPLQCARTGLAVHEVCQALGCSPGTVRSIASRGVSSLRGSIAGSDSEHDVAG
jgi:DNA-directed RNA polymerase specialized sigma24 family protein